MSFKFLKFIILILCPVFLISCVSMSSQNERAPAQIVNSISQSLNKRLTRLWVKLTGAELFEIRKVYGTHANVLDSVEGIKDQAVIVEVWDYKTKRRVFLFSPEGSDQFFEVQNAVAETPSQRKGYDQIGGIIYVEKDGKIIPEHVTLWTKLSKIDFDIDYEMLRPQRISQVDSDYDEERRPPQKRIPLEELTPLAEKNIIAGLNEQIKYSDWRGLRITLAYEVGGKGFYISSYGKNNSVYEIDGQTGKLVKTKLLFERHRSGSRLMENGKVKYRLENRYDELPSNVKQITLAEVAEDLKFKTFDAELLTTENIVPRTFKPEFYLKTRSGQDLFVSYDTSDTTAEKLSNADSNGYGSSYAVEVTIHKVSRDGTVQTIEHRGERSRDGSHIIYSGINETEILKLDLHKDLKILRNDWRISLIGIPFDKNFNKVEKSFNIIDRHQAEAAIKSCEGIFRSGS